jgi:type II secretory pathway component GspD/PulD (secretin)
MSAQYVRLLLVVIGLAGALRGAEPPSEQPLTIALPQTLEIRQLVEIVASFTKQSVQYNPQKITGAVNLAVQGEVTQAQLWDIFNQVLVGQGFTCILAGDPPIYHVVPIAEAAALSSILPVEELQKRAFAPGYGSAIVPLHDLSPAAAVKALSALFASQISQIRTLGEREAIVVSAPLVTLREVQRILVLLDRPGMSPEGRLFTPTRAVPASLQAATMLAWASYNRVRGSERLADVQVAPDGHRLMLIAAVDDIDALEKLAGELDRSEPVESRTYRPRFFGLDEVSRLVQSLLKAEGAQNQNVEVVVDPLTGSLIITATVAQHQRIADVMRNLDDAPASSRRQLRSLVVKNRSATELARVITSLLDAGIAGAGDPGAPAAAQAQPATAGTPPPPPAAGAAYPGANPTTPLALPAGPPASPGPLVGRTKDGSVTITTDELTNRLICLGDPRVLDQIETLLRELDKRQAQVELEVILVTLSTTQSRDLGVELIGRVNRNEISATVTSLFGLSAVPPGNPTQPTVNSPAGLTGVLINPGDYAGVVRALETVSEGHSLIRSMVVVNNNTKATVNGVVQEPITSINSGQQVATTTYAGTTDAGTQLAIEPLISAGDHVTLTYSISQSAFLGTPTVTSNGSVIPPTRRTDSVSSVATIPDGYVIALGGLSNRSTKTGESRLPFLGGIPVLGYLFKQESKGESESRFYVFIRANVLRHNNFEDLRSLTDGERRSAPADIPAGPELKPEFLK